MYYEVIKILKEMLPLSLLNQNIVLGPAECDCRFLAESPFDTSPRAVPAGDNA